MSSLIYPRNLEKERMTLITNSDTSKAIEVKSVTSVEPITAFFIQKWLG